ncbi:MAG TPA: hypothetical protein VFH54_04230, partial [Mycobacteriales bacterium]|nr:hypothetical protein [Mycobacteriales bacterium]
LGLEIDDVARLRASARARVGAERLARRECRGWGLVGRRSGLTPQETAAADAHRALCWPCRDRLREQRRVRERLEIRSAAVTATVLADVVALTVPAGGATTAGIVGVTASKVATAVVGAGALAVAVTSAGLAVARVHPAQPAQPQQTRQVQPHQPSDRSVPVRPLVTGAAEPASEGPASGAPARQLPVKPALPPLSARPQLPASLTVPTLVPTALPTLLPAAIPTALPTLLPTPLPTPLQSLLPTALPTSIPTVPLSLGGTP